MKIITITITIADDHPLTIQAVGSLISQVPGFEIIHECQSGADLLKRLGDRPTDIVVTDFGMSRDDRSIDGFALLRGIRKCVPASGVVLLTAQTNPSVLMRAMRQFVNAVVCKEDDIGEVVRACLFVQQGGGGYCSPIAKALMDRARAGEGERSKKEELTHKELEVLRLYAAGHSLVQIADKCSRAVSTISSQKYTAMRKLNLTSNTDLIRYAYETGLI